MGWQSDDPGRDFRRAPAFSLAWSSLSRFLELILCQPIRAALYKSVAPAHGGSSRFYNMQPEKSSILLFGLHVTYLRPAPCHRAAGEIALEALLFMAQRREATFRRLMGKTEGTRNV